MNAKAHLWRSEDNFMDLILSLSPYMGPRDWIQVNILMQQAPWPAEPSHWTYFCLPQAAEVSLCGQVLPCGQSWPGIPEPPTSTFPMLEWLTYLWQTLMPCWGSNPELHAFMHAIYSWCQLDRTRGHLGDKSPVTLMRINWVQNMPVRSVVEKVHGCGMRP